MNGDRDNRGLGVFALDSLWRIVILNYLLSRTVKSEDR